MIVPRSIRPVTAKEMIDLIKKKGGRLLTDVNVFDVYVGENVEEGKKSIAFKLTFNDPTKTLTDNEVNTIFENVIGEVEKAFNAELRNITLHNNQFMSASC